jgi:hypothetical protein
MKSIFKNSLLVLMVLSLASCENWLDVNDDPNNPTDVAPEFVLPAAQASLVGVVGGDFAIVGGLWSQHWTQAHVSAQYKTLDSYDLSPDDYDNAWTELYAGGLNDFEDVKNKAKESGNNNLLLQATVGQAYGFQILADFFDKIPFSEALNVASTQSPKYDDGAAVYAELIRRIDEALALDFDNNTTAQVSSDLVFGKLGKAAQIDQWKRFANTLKLKMYLRQTASPNGAQAVAAIKSMLDNNTQFLTSAAAVTSFVDEPNRSNPLYENNVRQLNVASNLRLSNTLLSFLRANDDLDRLNAYFTPGASGQSGLEQGNHGALTSVIPAGVPSVAKMSATDPFFFFSFDEINFMLAEAYLRVGNSAQAKSFYDKGVQAAYAKFSIPFDASRIAEGGVYALDTDADFETQLKTIIIQKWVSMFRQGHESFWDQARTGYPETSPVATNDPSYVAGKLTYSVTGVTNRLFPKRLLFPTGSRSVNVNTPAQVPVTTKVWWMK